MPPNKYRYPEGDGIPRQSERTSSENKERAYIAASRRSDRSLEARVQSAHAASNIHKERTGKFLKVTEEIVAKEEMYEEEDDLPARYHAILNNPLFVHSPRAGAYAITQFGMRDAVAARLSNGEPSTRVDEVNRQFAQVFPRFGMPPGLTTSLNDQITVNSQIISGPRPSCTQPTPTQVTASYSPAMQTQQQQQQQQQQPGYHNASPQMVFSSPFGNPTNQVDSPVSGHPTMHASPRTVFNSPYGNPTSQGDTPVPAHPTMPGNILSSPILNPSMATRSMSLSQAELALNDPRREVPSSPPVVVQYQQQTLRRSYAEAFPSSQSPLATPIFSGTYPSGTPLCSPGMPPGGGSSAARNRKMQRRATAHPITMSPGGMHPMHAAGFTTQLPPNVINFWQPQNGDRSASFSGVQADLFTPPHTGAPASQGVSFVPPTAQDQFQLQCNLNQVQSEKKRRRSAHETKANAKTKVKAKAKAKASAIESTNPASLPSVESMNPAASAAPAVQAADNIQKIKNYSSTSSLATPPLIKQDQALQALLEIQHSSNLDFPDYNLHDMVFDANSFQAFNNPDTYNLNFDDNFMNDFVTFPASQPENDSAQVAS